MLSARLRRGRMQHPPLPRVPRRALPPDLCVRKLILCHSLMLRSRITGLPEPRHPEPERGRVQTLPGRKVLPRPLRFLLLHLHHHHHLLLLVLQLLLLLLMQMLLLRLELRRELLGQRRLRLPAALRVGQGEMVAREGPADPAGTLTLRSHRVVPGRTGFWGCF